MYYICNLYKAFSTLSSMGLPVSLTYLPCSPVAVLFPQYCRLALVHSSSPWKFADLLLHLFLACLQQLASLLVKEVTERVRLGVKC